MKVGDSLEIPALNETRKVKSIQMFRVRQKKIRKDKMDKDTTLPRCRWTKSMAETEQAFVSHNLTPSC